jgi:hypothetical protein
MQARDSVGCIAPDAMGKIVPGARDQLSPISS